MSTKQFKVLVIGGRDFQVQGLNDLGIFYTLFQKKDELTPYQIDHADELLITEYQELDNTLALAKMFHRERQYDAVIGYREFAQTVCAEIAQQLGLPSNCDSGAVSVSRDKLKMRQALAENGQGNVAFAKVESLAELQAFMAELQKPAILKPLDGTGSLGVIKVTPETVEHAYQYVSAHSNGAMLAEEYIGGSEYSVESLSKGGKHQVLAITEKLTTQGPYFVEMGHNQPASLSSADTERVVQAITRLLDTLGHQTGPCHSEIKIFEGEVFVIETHTRNGGDNIWEMTRLTTGVDIFKHTICHLLAIPEPIEKPASNAIAVRYFLPQVEQISKITGVTQVEQQQGIYRLEITSGEGSRIGSLESSHNRAGYVMALGESLKQAVEQADFALDSVIFE
ncbi:ATP-grasp domain-containing protein [Pseudoalteromonas sp. T1lg23B]|uniref:ATP-grasp domain-containing protein n=1 Tax=Pseudoalteromonas sp. T1lg23B TaxID=2077097 RepID=UPI000CF70056|nr:ATP-grasp domain-containing protein [Pseudoalteromonas sp. T1lg23B]